MATKKTGQPYIPTGYEHIQRGIADEREIAKAMLESGLAGPGPNAGSWTQLAGSLAQAFAGKSGLKEAQRQEEGLNLQRMSDFQMRQNMLADAVRKGAPLEETAAMVSANADLANSPYGQAVAEALSERMKNQQTVGDLQRVRDPATGQIVTVARDKTGRNIRSDVEALPDITNVNDVAVALNETAPGTVLPQNLNNLVVRGEGGQPQLNEPLFGAKRDIAAAGAARYNAQFVNTGESEYAKKVGGALGEADAATLTAAVKAPQTIRTGQQVLQALDSGAITGTAAGLRYGTSKLFATLGITDGESAEQTGVALANMAKMTFDYFQSTGVGARGMDTEKEWERIKEAQAGNIDWTEETIRAVIKGSIRSAQQAQQNALPVLDRMSGNPATANITPGFAGQVQRDIANPPQPSAPASPTSRAAAIRAELKARRARGGN